MKVCTKCKVEKPFSEYSHKRPKNRKPGLQPRCKTCCVEDTRSWYKNNKSKAKESRLQKAYGIGLNEYNARLVLQNNSCLLCDKIFVDGPFGPDSPVIDHCHITGKVRGILCNECNRGLGYFHDNPEALLRAASYVQNTNEF